MQSDILPPCRWEYNYIDKCRHRAGLSKQNITDKHKTKSYKERVSSTAFIAVCMGYRNQYVSDNLLVTNTGKC